MKILILLFSFVHIAAVLYSQNNEGLDIKEKARIYYANEKQLQGTESANYAADFFDKHRVFPSDKDVTNFHRKWRESRRESLSKEIALHLECINEGTEFIRERLLIWELKKGKGLPDSTFTILMTKYFEANKDEAIEFCIQRWDVQKIHQSDFLENQEIGDEPTLKNHPYVSFLFEQFDLSELLKILILESSISDYDYQKLIDLVFEK